MKTKTKKKLQFDDLVYLQIYPSDLRRVKQGHLTRHSMSSRGRVPMQMNVWVPRSAGEHTLLCLEQVGSTSYPDFCAMQRGEIVLAIIRDIPAGEEGQFADEIERLEALRVGGEVSHEEMIESVKRRSCAYE